MGVRQLTNMNFFVLFALAGAASGAAVQKKDPVASTLACTAGTSLGDNLATAFTTCAPASMRIEEKLQLSRQDKVCYSYEDIMKWVQTRYADNICVLKSIGWLNDNMDANEDLIKSDVISLDPVVTAPLFAGHRECIAKVMDDVEEHECLTNGAYTKEEQAAVLETAENIASYECFLSLFEKGCMNFLSANSKK